MIGRRLLIGFVSSLGAIAAIALVTFGLTRATGLSTTGNDSPPASGADVRSEEADTRPNDQLTVCVQYFEGDAFAGAIHGAGAEILAKTRVEGALPALETHPYWDLAGFVKPPVVDIGCPSPPYPLVAGSDIKLTEPTTIPSVLRPSYYRVFVFVLPSLQTVSDVLGSTEVRVRGQEVLCDGPEGTPPCWGITPAIYVSELQQGSVSVPRLLEQALGFADRGSAY